MSTPRPEKHKRKREVSNSQQQERPTKKPALTDSSKASLKNLPPLRSSIITDNSELAPVLSMQKVFESFVFPTLPFHLPFSYDSLTLSTLQFILLVSRYLRIYISSHTSKFSQGPFKSPMVPPALQATRESLQRNFCFNLQSIPSLTSWVGRRMTTRIL